MQAGHLRPSGGHRHLRGGATLQRRQQELVGPAQGIFLWSFRGEGNILDKKKTIFFWANFHFLYAAKEDSYSYCNVVFL